VEVELLLIKDVVQQVDQVVVAVIFYLAQLEKVEQEQLVKEMLEVMQGQVQVQVRLVEEEAVALQLLVQMEPVAVVVMVEMERM
jgi:RNase H-fold protein (predicted Holliday junction resolvase)